MSPDIDLGITRPDTITTVGKITLPQGLASLSSDLLTSNGIGAVVVHPYYRQRDMDRGNFTEDEAAGYHRYVSNLRQAVRLYRNLQIPIIIFEEAERIESLDSDLSRMEITDGRAYIVPTEPANPWPVDITLPALANLLKSAGLQRATVLGSNFWTREYGANEYPTDYYGQNKTPSVANKYRIGGCVGATMNRLIHSGIYATHGFATFPNSDNRLQHPNSVF